MEQDKLRMRCLELAGKQVGPWLKGKHTAHQKQVLALAVMYETFAIGGYSEAYAIAENNVRPLPADLVKLVDHDGDKDEP